MGQRFHSHLNMLNRKTQGSIELIMVMGAVMFFFVSIMLVINYNTSDKNKESMSEFIYKLIEKNDDIAGIKEILIRR